MVAEELAQLRRRLQPGCGAVLDATAGCTFVMEEAAHGYAGDLVCGRFCGEEDRVCDCCSAYHCVFHHTQHLMHALYGVAEDDTAAARCACCRARMCNNCAEYAALLEVGGQHACELCKAANCPDCILGGRVAAYAECESCGMAACDACVRKLRIRVRPAAEGSIDDADGSAAGGMRFSGGGNGGHGECRGSW
jgi:hypothetical protein